MYQWRQSRWSRWDGGGVARLLVGAFLSWSLVASGQSGSGVGTESALGFFTNVATRLLRAEFNLDLNRLQVFPTNQYTPAVHRLLQVTANLYDTGTNRPRSDDPNLPSLFRPVFLTTESGAVYIQGYEEVTNAALVQSPPPIHDLSDARDRVVAPLDQVYGIPLIIGAKKGFPNFNELAMQTEIRVARRLEFRRPPNPGPFGGPSPVNETNQMYTLSISNTVGVEAWNSYSNAFPRGLELRAVVETTVVLTNELGEVLLSNRVWSGMSNGVLIPPSAWAGYNPTQPSQVGRSFVLLLVTNFMFLSNATYRENSRQFVAETPEFERHPERPLFTVPHWWIQLRTRLHFSLVDAGTQRLVDLVDIQSAEQSLDLTGTLMMHNESDLTDCGGTPYLPNGSPGGFWCTNRWPNAMDLVFPTYGILNQILLGRGAIQAVDPNSVIITPVAGLDVNGTIDFFRTQFDLPPFFYPGKSYAKTNVFYAPFSPGRQVFLFTSWQVNDPLVHSRWSDLQDLNRTNTWGFSSHDSTIANLGSINKRYEPWAGNPSMTTPTQTTWCPAVKDPRLFMSENWDFPSRQVDDLAWVGGVHRGTPWQTLYLKSEVADPALWKKWLGVEEGAQAQALHPTNDWRLVSRLAPMLGTNAPQNRASINTSEEGWMKLLDGLMVLTNTSSESDLRILSRQRNPLFESQFVSSNSPQAELIAAAIHRVRESASGGAFSYIGGILAVPALSLASPFLNTNGLQLRRYGLSEAAYEALPRQLLSRVRPDSIGSLYLTNNTLLIQFTGQEDAAYIIESSIDLEHWFPVATNHPSGGFLRLQDAVGPTPRYYRSSLVQ